MVDAIDPSTLFPQRDMKTILHVPREDVERRGTIASAYLK
jgi:hypothetical protein